MQTGLFIAITLGLFALYLAIGYLASRRNVSSLDYLLAGKSLGIPTVTASLLAAQVGGGMFLGTAQSPFHGLLYIFGVSLGLLILGLGIAEKMRAFDAATVGEILETTYQSISLRHIAVVLSLISLTGILIGQILAIKSVLVTFANIHDHLFFILFWLGIVTYTVIGGFHTVIITDFFRIIFIILTFSAICIYSLVINPVAFFSAENLSRVGDLFSTSGLTWSEGLRIVLVPALFCLIEEDLAQKFFSARTQRIAGISALCASILLILFSFVPFYFGIEAQLLGIVQVGSVSPLLPVLKALTNNIFFTVALCGLLAAITSTSDSLLCAISSTLTKPAAHLLSLEPSIHVSRFIVFVAGIFTLAVSYLFPQEIINVLVGSYEISICALFIPFLGSLFLKERYSTAALAAAVTGLILFFLFRIPLSHVPQVLHDVARVLSTYAPHATGITLIGSFIAYALVHVSSARAAKNENSSF